MPSLFESDFSFFDPSSRYESNFVSFSAYADLYSSPEDPCLSKPKERSGSVFSDGCSPLLSDQFQTFPDILEDQIPGCSEAGIFHTPFKTASGRRDNGSLAFSHRSSASEESLGTPSKPSSPMFVASSDPFTFSTPTDDVFLSPENAFSWDDISTSISASSYAPPTPGVKPFRMASNPTLGAPRNPRQVKQVVSMPLLREESLSTGEEWLQPSSFSIRTPRMDTDATSEDSLTENFGMAFGDYGLNNNGTGPSGPVFAFEAPPPSQLAPAAQISFSTIPHQQPYASSSPTVPHWQYEGPTMQAHVGLFPSFHLPYQEINSGDQHLTVNPMAVMPANVDDESVSRPLTAPGLQSGEITGPLSAPMSKRSLSSSGYKTSKSAPVRDLFSYAPQQNPVGPPGPRPLYTSDPSPSYHRAGPSHPPRAMPTTPTPHHSGYKRAVSEMITPVRNMKGQHFPTGFPPTPDTPEFSTALPSSYPAAIGMQRAETNPLPRAHKTIRSSHIQSSLMAAYGQDESFAGQFVDEEYNRPTKRARRVSMTEARNPHQRSFSDGRPLFATNPQVFSDFNEPPHIFFGSPSTMQRTAYKTVHPPAYKHETVGGTSVTPAAKRIHPPPHPGTSRPIARLPSPSKRTPSSTNRSTPKTPPKSKGRSPSGRRNVTPTGPLGGTITFADDMFVNFTSKDADLLLSGVAPSGTMSKKKREREDREKADFEDGGRGKRSRTEDE